MSGQRVGVRGECVMSVGAAGGCQRVWMSVMAAGGCQRCCLSVLAAGGCQRVWMSVMAAGGGQTPQCVPKDPFLTRSVCKCVVGRLYKSAVNMM